MPPERAWDYLFKQGKPYWMLITLNNGKKVGGRFDSNSFASSAPAQEQIFLEESWIINDKDGFDRVKDSSAGLLISATEITMIELVNIENEEDDEHKKANSIK